MMKRGMEFIKETCFQGMKASPQMQGRPEPPKVKESKESSNIIHLPKARELNTEQLSLTKAIKDRCSVRKYSEAPLSREELSFLLWSTQGVKDARVPSLRTVPSAGARHALETYLLINRVQDIQRGIYRYLPVEHSLEELQLGSHLTREVVKGCLDQKFVGKSAVTMIWTALFYRMTWRYGDRGFRYLLLDAGHACQNLYLAAEAIEAGVCAVGAYLDDKLNQLLELDVEREWVIYLAAVGKKR